MTFQELALVTVEERADYIRTAAADSGLGELIIEKDFWVVWLLEQLFALSPTLGPFTFKGGTSLSKGYLEVIARLKKAGSDTDLPTDVVHHFYIPTFEDARLCAMELGQLGFQVRAYKPPGRLGWNRRKPLSASRK